MLLEFTWPAERAPITVSASGLFQAKRATSDVDREDGHRGDRRHREQSGEQRMHVCLREHHEQQER